MCGRYALKNLSSLFEEFPDLDVIDSPTFENILPRYNASPIQHMPVIAMIDDLAQRNPRSNGSFHASGRRSCFMRTPIIRGARLVSGDLVSSAHILRFGHFWKANRSSLEENVLIRIGGDEDFYARFNLDQKVENGAFFMFRRGRH
jgi:hypothetical protein